MVLTKVLMEQQLERQSPSNKTLSRHERKKKPLRNRSYENFCKNNKKMLKIKFPINEVRFVRISLTFFTFGRGGGGGFQASLF